MTVSCVTTDNVASQFVVCVTARVCDRVVRDKVAVTMCV